MSYLQARIDTQLERYCSSSSVSRPGHTSATVTRKETQLERFKASRKCSPA